MLLSFIAFLVISHFLLMQIFRFTTFHSYFWKGLPVLIGYGALVGYLLFKFELHPFFTYQVVLASIWLFFVAKKQNRLAEAMLMHSGDEADAVRAVAISTGMTKRYYAYSSFIYVITFSMTYLWFYNA